MIRMRNDSSRIIPYANHTLTKSELSKFNLRFHLKHFVRTMSFGRVVDDQIEFIVHFGEQPDLFAHTEPCHGHQNAWK